MHALPGHGGARLDDRRRGRGPGPGEAGLRARPRRGRHRADPQPAVPRGARRGQAGSLRDRRSRSTALSVPSVAVELAQRTLGDLSSRLRARGRRRRDGRAHRPRARRRAAWSLRSSPTAATTGRSASPSASAAARSGSRSSPSSSSGADIVVASTSSPHHVIEREALAEVMAARRGRPAAADRPRGSARHPSGLPRPRRGRASTTWTTCRRSSSGTRPAARPRRGERRAILRAELARFERWLGSQDVVPTIAALRAPRRRGRRSRPRPRTSRGGSPSASADRERLRGDGPRDRQPAAARADPAAEARVRRRRRVRLRQRAARAVRPRRRERADRGRRRRGPTSARGSRRERPAS